MKRLPLFLLLAAASLLIIWPVPYTDAAATDDVTVIGISQLSSSSNLKLGIDSEATVAYPDVTWYVYLPADAHVTGTDPLGTIVDEDLIAGLHIYTRSYEPGESAAVTWDVAGRTSAFNIMIASSASAAYEHVSDGKIRVDPDAMIRLEREVAAGCIILVIAPSIFLIPFWKRRKDRGVSNAFE